MDNGDGVATAGVGCDKHSWDSIIISVEGPGQCYAKCQVLRAAEMAAQRYVVVVLCAMRRLSVIGRKRGLIK